VKLAFVVQRYGADIAGGSEAHCREIALRLSGSIPGVAPATPHDITVLTTCARDYVTWANTYAPGESRDRNVRVVRFAVARPRRLKTFADLSDEVFDGGAPREKQDEWFRENGPDAPGLLEHLAARGGDYDLVLFWTFRYATSYFGLPRVARRAILVPTAEEDPAIRLEVLEEFFRKPAGYLFVTPEEETLVSARAGRPLKPSATIGIGIDPAPPRHTTERLSIEGIDGDYVLYLGRVDRNKGCHTLLEYFATYAASSPAAPMLLLAGPSTMQIPPQPRIRALGYVSNERRETLLANARALIVPSRYESLSIVLLEAWNHAVPALVNAECKVLEGQVRRASGGLTYRSAAEFHEALDCLVTSSGIRDRFGRQGLAYVEREYRWPTVLGRVEALLQQVDATNRGDAAVRLPE
jgi:glycosyltransferase involved in cell wall biosynthesis